jgi:DNA-binding winged helix-turn-helix (wHTH) protein/TolB-like protein/tetratricopeptide (TPR) repeat protein
MAVNRAAAAVFEFGEFRLDVVRRLLSRAGAPVPLTTKAFDVLAVLVQNAGAIVTKDQLLDAVWPDCSVEESNLTVAVSILRKTLGEHPQEHRYIVTVPGRGYRFVAPVRAVEPEDTPALIAVPEADTMPALVLDEARAITVLPPRLSSRWDFRTAALLVVACSAAAPYVFTRTETAPRPQSIAVLPLKMLEPAQEDPTFGLKLANAIITELSKNREIAVRPTSAIVPYATAGLDVRTAGRELDVDLVLDGSIQRSSDRVRVTLQLVDVGDGTPRWADTFDTVVTSSFGVQDLIGRDVAAALHAGLRRDGTQPGYAAAGEQSEAYRLYVKGRHFLVDRSEEGLRKGLDFFERAIRVDPAYAPAHAGRADAYSMLGNLGYVRPTESFPLARISALHALKLDSQLAEAHTALAYVRHRFEWDWPGAEHEFKQALELNPNSSEARHWYAHFLQAMGRLDEAIVESSRARQLNPLSPVISANLGSLFTMARQYDEAIALCREVLEIAPQSWLGHRHLARAYANAGAYDLSVASYRTAVELSGHHPFVIAELGRLHARRGHRAAARRVLQDLEQISVRRYVPSYERAAIHAGLGEVEPAFEWLEKAYDERSAAIVFLKMDREFEEMRHHSRFAALLKKMRL